MTEKWMVTKTDGDYSHVSSWPEGLGDVCTVWCDEGRHKAKLIAEAPAMRDVLVEIEDYLDDRADADNGIPNDAMRLLTEVRAILARSGVRS